MMSERPLPPVPLKRLALIVVPFIALAALAAWLMRRYYNNVAPIMPFALPAVIGFFYYLRRRCPACHRRLKVRRDYFAGTRRFRLLLDCPRCQIAWDTGVIGDEG